MKDLIVFIFLTFSFLLVFKYSTHQSKIHWISNNTYRDIHGYKNSLDEKLLTLAYPISIFLVFVLT